MTSLEYDALSRATRKTDANGHATAFEYDTLGHLTKATFADGTQQTSQYDFAGRRTASTDPLGNTTRYSYDLQGRVLSVTSALNEVTSFGYDALGRLATSTNALGRVTSFQYDALGRPIRTTYPDSTEVAHAYDAQGRRISSTDEADRTTLFAYDALGRLMGVTDALGQTTAFAHDAANRLVAQTDANGHITTFEYDPLGRRTKRTLPAGQFESLAYDLAGNLVSHTDFNARVSAYEYDALNHLVRKTPDATFATPPLTWTYDPVGVRTSMTDPSGVTTYDYDNRYRLVSKTKTWGSAGVSPADLSVSLTYSYDSANNVTGIQSSSANGTSLTYQYDALNRLRAVVDAQHGATTYAYDPVGTLAQLDRPNGTHTAFEYDLRDRPTRVSTQDAAANIFHESTSTLHPTGRRLTTDEQLVLGGQTFETQRSYSYDALYRLTAETIEGTSYASPTSLTYSYDPVGNRLSRAVTGLSLPTQSFAYDENNRLTTDTYDANGNTLQSAIRNLQSAIESAPPTTLLSTYDLDNRLIQAETTRNSQLLTVNFQYDADGRRARKTAAGRTTYFMVDELSPTGYPQVVEELTVDPSDPLFTSPQVTALYTYGHAPLLQDVLVDPSGTPQWQMRSFGQDAHGNVRFLTDPSGAATDRYDYDAFGNLIASAGSSPARRLHTGEEFDSDLGLYYLRARYTDPDRGRFWTRDPFEGVRSAPQTLHSYAYAHNDPVNFVDPSGYYTLNESLQVSGLAPTVRGIMDQLWSGANNYVHGLGGGDALKAVNSAEAIYIQGLSQHRGVQLGRRNYWAAQQGAPFLLPLNPFITFTPSACIGGRVIGFDASAPIYGCANREPVFTFETSPLFDEVLIAFDFAHGSIAGAQLRDSAAFWAEQGARGDSTGGNAAYNITAQLLGMAAGAVSPADLKHQYDELGERAQAVMARELAGGGSSSDAFAQGISTIVGDVVGYDGIMEAGFGVDRATTELLTGIERIERGGFGLAQLATSAAGAGRLARRAESLNAAVALRRAEPPSFALERPQMHLETQPGPCAEAKRLVQTEPTSSLDRTPDGSTSREISNFEKHLGEKEADDIVFWAGGTGANRTAAQEFAVGTGRKTLNQTAEGAALDVSLDYANMSVSEIRAAWADLSEQTAANQSGTVYSFAGGAAPDTIWRTVELPTLLRNPNVRKIIIKDAQQPWKTAIKYR